MTGGWSCASSTVQAVAKPQNTVPVHMFVHNGDLRPIGEDVRITSLAAVRGKGGVQRVVATCDDGTVYVFRAIDGEYLAMLQDYDAPSSEVWSGPPVCVASDPSGRVLVVGGAGGSLVGWDLAAESVLWRTYLPCAGAPHGLMLDTHPKLAEARGHEGLPTTLEVLGTESWYVYGLPVASEEEPSGEPAVSRVSVTQDETKAELRKVGAFDRQA